MITSARRLSKATAFVAGLFLLAGVAPLFGIDTLAPAAAHFISGFLLAYLAWRDRQAVCLMLEHTSPKGLR